jgi:hypothetical protein
MHSPAEVRLLEFLPFAKPEGLDPLLRGYYAPKGPMDQCGYHWVTCDSQAR